MDKDKQIKELQERVARLAQEKAQLSLLNEMFANFKRSTTLEGIIDTIISEALSLHGGQNVTLYYSLNDEWFFKDLIGNSGQVDISENECIKRVLDSKKHFDDIESIPKEAELVNINLDDVNTCTSYFPLVFEDVVLAVLVLEKRLIFTDTTVGDFSTFFSYAGIILKNEIDNTKRLEFAKKEFDQIYQSSLDGILLIDSHERIIKCNQAFCEIFKCDQSNVGKYIYSLDKFAFLSMKLKEIKEKTLDHLEFDHQIQNLENNLELFCIISISALKDYRKRIYAYAINVKDITARQKVRNELKAVNQRMSIATKAARLGYFEMDLLKEELIWDDLLYEIYGYDRNCGIDKLEYFNSIIHPEDFEWVTNSFKNSLQPGTPDTQYEDVYRIVINSNEVKYIKTNSRHLKDGDGNVVRIIGASQDITEQKVAEALLKESEERYRSLHESAGLGIGYYTTDGVVISYNDIAARNMGGKPEDFAGKSMFELFPKEAAEEYMRRINASVLSAEPINYEDNVPLPPQDFWFLSTYARILDKEGNIIGIQIISSDISEQKNVQKALKDSEERFDLAMKAANDGVWDWNLETNEIYFSPRWKEMIGYKDHELANEFSIWEKLTKPEDVKRSWEVQQEVIEQKRDRFVMEFEMKHKDGHWVEILSRSEAFFNKEGKAVRMVGTHVDITESKAIQKNLKESEEKYRTLLENLPVGVFRSNLKGEVLSANLAMAEIFGYNSVKELLKRPAPKYYHNSSPREQMLKLLKEKGSLTGYETKEYKKDGTVIWVSANYRLLNNIPVVETGEELIDGVITDITEKKKYESELIIAKEKAEESDRLKSAFLSNMSHEIRTPMNGILGFTDLLKEPQLSGDTKDKYIEIIEKSGKRMLATINDIIDISKIEAGQVEVSKMELSINTMLDEQYDFFVREADKKQLEINYNRIVPDSDSHIVSDKHKLEGILTNLIKNAVKYTESGSITFGCKIKVINGKDVCEFYVKDTGIGVPAYRIDAIFNRFEQADIEDAKVFEGSGLGLAITKSYVEMLGGKIGVKSIEGKGSTFYFYIPYTRPNDKKSLTEQNLNDGSKLSLRNLSIIVAEDDDVSRMLLETILENEQREILYAATGKETIDLCKEYPDTDIILMDIRMPDMNGIDATKEIRKINQNVIIIAQTAHGLTGDKERALEAGCDDYIAKPIKKEILFEIMQNCINKKSI